MIAGRETPSYVCGRLLLASIHLQIPSPLVDADDLVLINFFARLHKEPAPLLN